VRQWGRVHIRYSPLNDCSLFWHLSACSNNMSCCWISFRFSGSGVSLPGAGGLCEVVDPPRTAGWPTTSSCCLGGCVCRDTCTTGWLATMSLCVCVHVWIWGVCSGRLASRPGLLTPAFVACSINAGEGLVKLSHVQWRTWTCGGVAHSFCTVVKRLSESKKRRQDCLMPSA